MFEDDGRCCGADLAVRSPLPGALHAAVNAHDAEAVAARCGENVVWDDRAAPEPLRGREAGGHLMRAAGLQGLTPRELVEWLEGLYGEA